MGLGFGFWGLGICIPAEKLERDHHDGSAEQRVHSQRQKGPVPLHYALFDCLGLGLGLCTRSFALSLSLSISLSLSLPPTLSCVRALKHTRCPTFSPRPISSAQA